MSLPAAVLPLVREFSSNSMKYLFRTPDNVADLLRWQAATIAERIDFARMRVEPDTFITPGFASLESDVLLRAPFRRTKKEWVEVFIHFENQTEPDELMAYRVLRYVLAIYERQLTDWLQTHSNTRWFRFHPVLPIVLYTGRRRWASLSSFRSLVHEGTLFGTRLPDIDPVFLDLARVGADALQSEVGLVGWVLWLIQQSKRKRSAFADVLRQVVAQVDALPDARKQRWEELLWFAHALVYHTREDDERDRCAEFIRETVRTSRVQELGSMGKTIAQAIQHRERLSTKRDTLLLLLREKFTTVPTAIEGIIESTHDVETLDKWLRAYAHARKLSDITFNGE